MAKYDDQDVVALGSAWIDELNRHVESGGTMHGAGFAVTLLLGMILDDLEEPDARLLEIYQAVIKGLVQLGRIKKPL